MTRQRLLWWDQQRLALQQSLLHCCHLQRVLRYQQGSCLAWWQLAGVAVLLLTCRLHWQQQQQQQLTAWDCSRARR
jgi:hypothetical protein